MPIRHWDWSRPSGGHPALLGYATETAVSMVALAPVTGLPWQAAAIGLTGAAIGGAVYDARQGTTPGTLTTRALTWITSAAWSSWALATAPLTTTGWATGVAIAAVGLAVNAGVTRSEGTRSERKALLKLRRESVGILRDWEERLARVARIEGCEGVDVVHWPEKVGYTAEINLPPGGTTSEDLNGFGGKFAADMRLADGCGVEIYPGANRGKILVEVTLKDVMSQDIPYPEDFSELSIVDRFPIGVHRNGQNALGALCNDCGILVGETDAGKTNQLRVVTAQLARMPDALIWAIDTTGGGVALPWITPWATEGTADAPVVDWIAKDEDEACLMCAMAIEGIAARKAGYQQLMRQKKTDNKLPVSHEIPAIVILVDETASLSHDIKEMLDRIINEGRAMRVRVLICALRATQDVITAAMKLQAKWRVGMTVSDAEEVAYLFPGYIKVDPKDAPVAGSGWTMHTRLGPKKPTPFKGWHIHDELTDKVCAATAARRPKIDRITLDVPAGAAYTGRWARALPALYKGQQLTEAAQRAIDEAGEIVEAAAALLAEHGSMPANPPAPTTPDGYEGFSGGAADLFAAVEANINGTAPPAASLAEAPPAGPAPFPAATAAPRPTRPLDPRQLGWELLVAAGSEGYAPKELHTMLGEALRATDGQGGTVPAARTVSGWMSGWAKAGTAFADTSGQYTRYFARTDHPEAAPSAAFGEPPAGIDSDIILSAAELLISTQLGSTSMLQRKLRIGFAAARALMDYLHAHGIVGPGEGTLAREVWVKPQDLPHTIRTLSSELGVGQADLESLGLATAGAGAGSATAGE
ncbi:DNA translocase FtsK [Streptomyces sp. BE147]|uniref:DNA translocase FtsK n=1 Tax=Streptomyces sp. BE147 TaxID=3002524 RepID=UPI002E7636D7|nr:DNA translocase FtsK [Streptomyces sp. BE147]MEE1741199.1 DNA translocase FtsK [Streptomyces sp. BE147]